MIMPGIVFEELGFKYLGPIDGHNIAELENVLTRAKNTKGPVLVHVCTQKGRGYTYAEKNPAVFHGISPFEVETGEVMLIKFRDIPTYLEVKLSGLLKRRKGCCSYGCNASWNRSYQIFKEISGKVF